MPAPVVLDRQSVEHALFERENRFRDVLENIDEIVYSVILSDDPFRGRVEFVSGRVESVIGHKPEDFLQNEGLWFSLLCPEDIPALTNSTQRIMVTKRPGIREYRLRHRLTGEYRWMEDRVVPQLDETGNIRGILGVARDVTERKQAEQVLQESEERYRALVESSPTSIFVSMDERFAYVNGAMCRLLGARSPEQLLGTPVFERFHPDFHAVIRQQTERIRDHSEAVPMMDQRYLRLDGSVVEVETVAIPITFRGQPAAQVMVNDVTARKRAEERLRATEERFATVFHSNPIGICITTLEEGTILDANKAFLKSENLALADILGRTSLEMGYWPDPNDRRRMLRELKARGSLINWEVSFRRQDGTISYSLQSLERITLDGQDCILTMLSDITNLKLAEQKLKQIADRLGALLATAQTLGSTLDLDTMLDQLLHRLTQVISITNRSAIYIYDPQADVLVPRACRGNDAETDQQIRLQPGESISGKVFQSGRPVLLQTRPEIDALRGELRLENERLLAQDRSGQIVRSTVAVPLRTRSGEIIGTMTLASTRGTFTEDDLSLLEGVAVQAAMAIQNAELFDEVRAGRERLQALSRQLIATQESERHHLARELHDEIGQMLTAVSLQLHNMKSWCGTDLRSEMDAGISLIDHAIEQVRGLSLNLRPAMLDVLGLEAAVRWCVDQQREQTGWDVQLALRLESRLSPELEITCFRVVQGALTNIARHARASQVEVEIHQSDLELEVIVRDNGIGLNLDNVRQRSEQGESFGILAMRERVQLAGGTLQIASGSGQGTTIRAHFPLVPKTQATESSP